MDDCEEVIEDDYDSFDELFTQHFTDGVTPETGAPNSQSDYQDNPRPAIHTSGTKRSTNVNRRFVLPQGSSKKTSAQGSLFTEGGNLPWSQRYPPRNLEELAVHKKKVQEVELWLNQALTGATYQRLLVLRGPAGSGKTTTVSLLSNKLNFDILEWKTPSVFEYATREYVSLASQFDEFLKRGNGFRGLDLTMAVNTGNIRGNKTGAPRKRVILVDEFPTLSGRNFSTIAAFRLTLQRYISDSHRKISQYPENGASSHEDSPIVLIVSETFTNSDSSFSDNLTVHGLLGREICNHPRTTIIDFNSIAPTFMYKALNLVLEKDGHCSNRNKRPGTAIMKAISKSGDIRNALASLEIICLENSSSKPAKSKKAFRIHETLTASENETLKAITQRESKLGLFHAVGKIVYNKRDNLVNSEAPSPPGHLHHSRRPQISQVAVNELFEETGTDSQTFISALHENYVPSCSGSSFTEHLDGCTRALSDSDLLYVGQRGHSKHRVGMGISIVKSGASVDSIRQEDISYQVAARGLLFALPSPVNRQMPNKDDPKCINDSHRILGPPTHRLLQDMEETQGLIDSWAFKLIYSSGRPASEPKLGFYTHPPRRNFDGEKKEEQRCRVDILAATAMTMVSRTDLLLYQLPYMVTHLDDEDNLRELRRITSYFSSRGNEPNRNGLRQPEENTNLETSLKDLGSRQSLRPENTRYQGNMNDMILHRPMLNGEEQEQFILSDDDIVDDF